MKRMIKAYKQFDSEVSRLSEFDKWYNSLSSKQQADVDDLADDMGYPLYDDCSDAELSSLMECYSGSSSKKSLPPLSEELPPVRGSYDPSEADLYVVKIWHEIDPGHDVAVPEAAEEIIEVVAGSPSEAIELAKQEWSGPIDRIKIVDVNPEYNEEALELPFEACTDIKANETYFGVGGHFKHYIKTLAKQDAEEGQIIMTLNQFKGVVDQDDFEDLDEDEIEEGFSMYQDLVDRYTNEID